MEVGSLGGCFGKPRGLNVACDLGLLALEAALSKFPSGKRGDLWLRVAENNVEVARRVVFAYSVARGMKTPALTMAIDSSVNDCELAPNTPDEWAHGWLVSNYLPANAVPVPMEYVFPSRVRLEDGVVLNDTDDDTSSHPKRRRTWRE